MFGETKNRDMKLTLVTYRNRYCECANTHINDWLAKGDAGWVRVVTLLRPERPRVPVPTTPLSLKTRTSKYLHIQL